MRLQKIIETIVNYLARVHTGSEPNDNIKLANWTPNNGPFSYNFRQFIVQFTFRSREIEFFEKIFQGLWSHTMSSRLYFSSKICFTFATKRTSNKTCWDFSHSHDWEIPFIQFFSVAFDTNCLFRSIKIRLLNAANLIKIGKCHASTFYKRNVHNWNFRGANTHWYEKNTWLNKVGRKHHRCQSLLAFKSHLLGCYPLIWFSIWST